MGRNRFRFRQYLEPWIKNAKSIQYRFGPSTTFWSSFGSYAEDRIVFTSPFSWRVFRLLEKLRKWKARFPITINVMNGNKLNLMGYIEKLDTDPSSHNSYRWVGVTPRRRRPVKNMIVHFHFELPESFNANPIEPARC